MHPAALLCHQASWWEKEGTRLHNWKYHSCWNSINSCLPQWHLTTATQRATLICEMNFEVTLDHKTVSLSSVGRTIGEGGAWLKRRRAYPLLSPTKTLSPKMSIVNRRCFPRKRLKSEHSLTLGDQILHSYEELDLNMILMVTSQMPCLWNGSFPVSRSWYDGCQKTTTQIYLLRIRVHIWLWTQPPIYCKSC